MTHEREVVDPFGLLSGEVSRRAREGPESAYRLGRREAPLALPDWEYCSWRHRWDDPAREYRTLYCAKKPPTALRESLAPLRPSTKVWAELGVSGDSERAQNLGVVSDAWFESHVLAGATIAATGPLVDIEDIKVRERLAIRHAHAFQELGVRHLDIGELRGRERRLTQAISRSLWGEGAAGIRYRSTIDGEECYALFEGRALLVPTDEIMYFTPQILMRVSMTHHLQVSYDGWVEKYVKDVT